MLKLKSQIDRAAAFAIEAHGEQQRKYTGEPYWRHPERVAALVATVQHTEEMIAAAWLHDVVEDTPVSQYRIKQVFGERIARYVYWLTDRSTPEDGTRAVRKRIDREHIAKAPACVKTIKLADLIDNTDSIVKHDPGFAKVYLAEKRLLLEVLKQGDADLWQRAWTQIVGAETKAA
jgi:(p)ppGpp synthase/HD superfamily hydrolase